MPSSTIHNPHAHTASDELHCGAATMLPHPRCSSFMQCTHACSLLGRAGTNSYAEATIVACWTQYITENDIILTQKIPAEDCEGTWRSAFAFLKRCQVLKMGAHLFAVGEL
jgi:hypothetical protein